ncbi:hypothetical protein PHLGIDRAFT_38404 [Phlebiopsis gigantea 11061_1 CR5-6]|uniref:Uncharacterized protein n=1 Tax=Phlebiopsis gigantea (strain 11061_1 CR5-6) TaxID=745531 RepID=A0A0C3RNY6_PHLG1|nr:hypothetical protein PHLGIDRAFT_38404 [Phlebiopsis gigantea 11061_1 CR5-6]
MFSYIRCATFRYFPYYAGVPVAQPWPFKLTSESSHISRSLKKQLASGGANSGYSENPKQIGRRRGFGPQAPRTAERVLGVTALLGGLFIHYATLYDIYSGEEGTWFYVSWSQIGNQAKRIFQEAPETRKNGKDKSRSSPSSLRTSNRRSRALSLTYDSEIKRRKDGWHRHAIDDAPSTAPPTCVRASSVSSPRRGTSPRRSST